MNVHFRHAMRGIAPRLWLASLVGAASGCGEDGGGGEATTHGDSEGTTTLGSATSGDTTNDVLPNPWDTLPPYFDELMQQLAAG